VDGPTTAIVKQIEACGYVVEMEVQADGVCIAAINITDPIGTPTRYVKIDNRVAQASVEAARRLAREIGINLRKR